MNLRGKRMLVPGGAGFIGSAFCRIAVQAGYRVMAFDRLRYAGDARSIDDVCPLIQGDLADPEDVDDAVQRTDIIVNMAAASHVDNAIHGRIDPFVRTNILGVRNLAEAARRHKVAYVQVGSDEEYGPAPPGVFFDERAPLCPGNGYSASKAAGSLILRAEFNTYGTQVAITRCVNNYGPRQHPEKLIAGATVRAIRGLPVVVHGDGTQVRDWLWVEDHCRAVLVVVEHGVPGEIYNIAAHDEHTVNDVVEAVLVAAGRPHDLIEHVADRPGQDRRYGITNDKIRAFGWAPRATTLQIEETVRWYAANESWWQDKVPF